MEPMTRNHKILAMCKDTHSKVGMGHSQMPNKAEPKTNWSLRLWLRRIGGNRHGGKETVETGEIMAWHGSDLRWLSMQLLTCTAMGKQ